ncbi:hypothetical protein V6x_51610 [Gimesia chilikensis]|uniref:Uncharacterized protein n=1 Tax=Gimesia chilikensis TaxID=2605989 RepID=A0A517WJI8_9PLAN|nr:hypothetical protein [Gimesia chilikensis]KAA0134437.1 hypothetical protein FYZ48_20300 [Gimesia chilikensis]QDU05424.1 hypothetical protein V6x_51610 [Gimesia chilikensis]
MMDDQSQNQKRRFQTRFFETDKADQILPFVLEALNTVGAGSACVVRGKSGDNDEESPAKGIQLTAPLEEALLIEHQIEQMSKLDYTVHFESKILYPPIIKLKSDLTPKILNTILKELEILPPDLSCQCMNESDNSIIIFISGPAIDIRKQDYQEKVLPNFFIFMSNLGSIEYPDRRQSLGT